MNHHTHAPRSSTSNLVAHSPAISAQSRMSHTQPAGSLPEMGRCMFMIMFMTMFMFMAMVMGLVYPGPSGGFILYREVPNKKADSEKPIATVGTTNEAKKPQSFGAGLGYLFLFGLFFKRPLLFSLSSFLGRLLLSASL